MAQTASILNTLKSILKAQGKTYVDVANALNLTEASVKRLFSEQSFSLSRLDTVCQMLDMTITDLIQQMNESQNKIEQLTAQQEMEITEDLMLLLVMVCAFNHWTIDEITGFYKVSETECVSKLLKLDELKIIELLPNDKVKLMIAPNFKWIDNGPIQRFFKETVGQEFFDTDFKEEGECLFVLNGMLSKQSAEVFERKLTLIGKEFNELNNADNVLDLEKRKGTTFVMAMRNWEYGLFQHMKR